MRRIYGIFSLICGVIGLVIVSIVAILWTVVDLRLLGFAVIGTIVGMILGGLAIIFGGIGIGKDRSRGFGIAGLVIGIVTVVFGIIVFWFLIRILVAIWFLVSLFEAIARAL
jgi:hypothetical protein